MLLAVSIGCNAGIFVDIRFIYEIVHSMIWQKSECNVTSLINIISGAFTHIIAGFLDSHLILYFCLASLF